MPITPGDHPGGYEVLNLLRAGGMGEVYREESLGRAGRVDALSAVYLPHSKEFVTKDEGQFSTWFSAPFSRSRSVFRTVLGRILQSVYSLRTVSWFRPQTDCAKRLPVASPEVRIEPHAPTAPGTRQKPMVAACRGTRVRRRLDRADLREPCHPN